MAANSTNDCVLPFYFRNIAARGAIVKIQNSFIEALNNHQYTSPVNSLLGECLIASCLMSTHLKSSARLSIQARAISSKSKPNQAMINMLVAETYMAKKNVGDRVQQTQQIRGLARMNETVEPHTGVLLDKNVDLGSLLGRSQLAVTIEPDTGERYQGIVDAQADSLSNSLEDYFQQSEQLDTRFYLFASENQCAGMIMQEMPNHGGKSERHPIGFADEEESKLWEELLVMAGSLKREELINLPPEDCLHRLFHQHDYGTAELVPVQFACRCSIEGTKNAIKIVDYQELDDILKKDGEVALDCEFCSTRYRFDRKAIAGIKGLPDPQDTIN